MSATLVGRERELTELVQAVRAAGAGRGSLYLLAGDAGIGKTRLATELAEAAGVEGARVLWGWCWEGEGAPSFWPWIQVLRALLHGTTADTLAELGGEGSRHIARLVPERATGIDPADLDKPGALFRLFDSVATLLRHMTSTGEPLVLIFEDVHAADSASMHLLEFAAREVQRLRCLLVATYREHDLKDRPELFGPLAQAARHGQRMPLRGLNEEAVGRLIAERFGLRLSPPAVEQVRDATGGNPLFVHEYVGLLAAEGGFSDDALPKIVPEGVRDTIKLRLSTMSARTIDTLSLAAVMGRSFLVRPLAVAAGIDRASAMEYLADAVARGVLVEEAVGLGAYSFSHDLMRETLYGMIPPGKRPTLHLRVGEALERYYGARAEAHAPELAHHFSEATTLAGPERAIRYARAAAEQAEERFAFMDAVRVFGQAAELVDADADPTQLADLLLGQARNILRVFDPAAANDIARRAADAARRAGNAEQFARAALTLGGGHFLMAMLPTDVDLFEQALAALPSEDHPLRIRLLARLAQTVGSGFVPGLNDVERARPMTDEAVARARAAGDPGLLGFALFLRHFVFEDPVFETDRLRISKELSDIAEASGLTQMRVHGYGFRLMDLIRAGMLQDAKRIAPDFELVAQQFGEPFYVFIGPLMMCTLALLEGRLDVAEVLLAKARSLASVLPNEWTRAMTLAPATELRSLQGRAEEVADELPAFSTLPEGGPYVESLQLRVALDIGRYDEARPIYERLTGYAELDAYGWNPFGWSGPNSYRNPGAWGRPLILGVVADACYRLGDADRAEGLSRHLEPYASVQLSGGRPVHPPLGVGSYHLGSLAALLGRYDDAETYLQQAADFYERIGSPPWIIRTQHRYAEMILRRGHAGDRERAEDLARAADARARELGLNGLVPGGAPSPRPAEELSRVVDLRLEGEFWTVSDGVKTTRLKDSKGLRILQTLLRHPRQEFHALELAGIVEGARGSVTSAVAAAEGLSVEAGDAGEFLDARAKAAYRERIEQLRDDIAEAEAFSDTERLAKATEELDALTAELSRAIGLGGRDRKASSAAERARVNVTRTVRYAMEKVGADLPAVGRHLERAIKTGVFCSYEPDPDHPIEWRL